MNRPAQLASLRERLGTIEASGVERKLVSTAAEDGLRMRALHEWFAGDADRHDSARSLPLLPLLDIVRQGFAEGLLSHLVWVGRRVFPYPLMLARHEGLLAASIFVDPPHAASRLWAVDLALRSTTPTAVIADGQGLTLPHTRRLQLAASAGSGIALLARPACESHLLSAATTRWRAEPFASSNSRVGWRLTLLRNKDFPTLTDGARASHVEWSDEKGLVAVPAVVESGTRQTATQRARA